MATDVERFLIGWLAPLVPALVTAETPAEDDWPADFRVVRLLGVGGMDLGRTLDAPMVVVDTFTGMRRDTIALAGLVHAYLRHSLPGVSTGFGQTVNAVTTLQRPGLVSDENTQLRRMTASYQLILH